MGIFLLPGELRDVGLEPASPTFALAHGGWVNSENCYSPGLVAPTLLRPLILPSTGVWELAEGGRQGEDRRQRACSSWETTKGPRPASWSLGMSS